VAGVDEWSIDVTESGSPAVTAEKAPARRRWERVLSPVERLSEILFGLVMALSITGSLSVAAGGEEDVHRMLAAAIGCNTAWGIVDGLMYLMSALIVRYRGRALIDEIRADPDPERAHRAVTDHLPPLLAGAIRKSELEHVHRQLAGMKDLPGAGLTGRDLLGALAVFLLVFVSTLPIVVPFVLPLTPRRALRASHGVALVLLFAVGFRLGMYVKYRPLVVGAAMVALGASLMGIVVALGG
jgi:VIT1/CCC1 family predicted Fe2+/Mn2+ transporter